jgi:FtsZ-binding cell division protein ZapB
MVTLEQIRELEQRVGRAVETIRLLREENRTLRGTVDSAQTRMRELEELVSAFKSDQAAIEEGIRGAIEKLDELEDEVGEADDQKATRVTTSAEVPPAEGKADAESSGVVRPESVGDAEVDIKSDGHNPDSENKKPADEGEPDEEEEQDRELDIF